MAETVRLEVAGRTLTIETGKVAKQASGSTWVRYGDTVVLVAAVSTREPVPDRGFFPLMVDYQEKTYAAGKIPGGFFKREGRPTQKEILSSRQIDRSLRPLFDHRQRHEIQIVATVLSADQENDSDTLALIGASAAVNLSEIPFPGPVGAVRMGRVNGQFIVNPTFAQCDEGDLELVVAGTKDSIVMVEGGAKQLPEPLILEALRIAHGEIKRICEVQEELVRRAGVAKRPVVEEVVDPALRSRVDGLVRGKIREAHRIADKGQRQEAVRAIRKEVVEALAADFPESETAIKGILEDLERDDLRRMILDEGRRADGRGTKDIRKITCEVGMLPRTHGSALFTRGETQSLVVTTLGTSTDEQRVEELEGQSWKSYMLHYNFPPFSVGEVKPMRGPGRREIGHGALAERAIAPVIPAEALFPYTIRIVSDILESNGSSSMATVCGGSLALMDAGVPIQCHVSGVAMGLIQEGSRVAILSDILGVEDHLGDMDFKVTGTRTGVTALQMDIKIEGLDFGILEAALAQAREGRIHVLTEMERTIPSPRADISPYAPRITILTIDKEKIREVIGPGGRMIRKITEETGATIDIEDDGTIKIAAYNAEGGRRAVEIIRSITEEPEIGRIYDGTVKRIVTFGAFVEIMPGRDGLVHISELDLRRVAKVEDVVKEGDPLRVKVIGIDNEGKIKLSRKALLKEQQEGVPAR